jgi:hypothetical protein
MHTKILPKTPLQTVVKKRIRLAVEFFLSYESLDSRKQRTFYTTSYLKGPWKYGKAKEAVESARAGLLPQEGDVRKSGRERKDTKEGKKVAPAKATFRVSQTKNSFFWFTSIGERPILIEESAPALFFYEEAMCKGSSGNGLLNAAKAVP